LKKLSLTSHFSTGHNSKGFTVIELLVSMGIITVILGMILFSYPRFKARSSLSALAREIGLLVREAQVYGLAVKEFPVRDSEFPPYGIHISSDRLKEVILFGDLKAGSTSGLPNNLYESGDGCGSEKTECIRRITITGPEYIDKICVSPGGGHGSGSGQEDICGINELNITFRRPDPEAVIVTDNPTIRYNAGKIYLRTTKDNKQEKIIRVWITGQISIP